MSTHPAPLIETERLLLTWPTGEQIDGYYEAIVGTDIFKNLLWAGPSGPQELHDWWRDNRAQDPNELSLDLNVAVIERATGRYIGGISLRPMNKNHTQIDIGYALAPDVHGRGYATEALGRIVDWTFAERGAERIFACIFTGNEASRRVLEKLNFLYEGTQRRTVFKDGRWIDEWVLAMIRPDWEAS